GEVAAQEEARGHELELWGSRYPSARFPTYGVPWKGFTVAVVMGGGGGRVRGGSGTGWVVTPDGTSRAASRSACGQAAVSRVMAHPSIGSTAPGMRWWDDAGPFSNRRRAGGRAPSRCTIRRHGRRRRPMISASAGSTHWPSPRTG